MFPSSPPPSVFLYVVLFLKLDTLHSATFGSLFSSFFTIYVNPFFVCVRVFAIYIKWSIGSADSLQGLSLFIFRSSIGGSEIYCFSSASSSPSSSLPPDFLTKWIPPFHFKAKMAWNVALQHTVCPDFFFFFGCFQIAKNMVFASCAIMVFLYSGF